jgi:hypothetical protein
MRLDGREHTSREPSPGALVVAVRCRGGRRGKRGGVHPDIKAVDTVQLMGGEFDFLIGETVQQAWVWGPIRLLLRLGQRPDPGMYVDVLRCADRGRSGVTIEVGALRQIPIRPPISMRPLPSILPLAWAVILAVPAVQLTHHAGISWNVFGVAFLVVVVVDGSVILSIMLFAPPNWHIPPAVRDQRGILERRNPLRT